MTIFEHTSTPGNYPRTIHRIDERMPFIDMDAAEETQMSLHDHADLDFVPEYGTKAETDTARTAWLKLGKQLGIEIAE